MMMTSIESEAISKILMRLGVSEAQMDFALERLRVDRREWSDDAADTSKCVGEFVYFSTMAELPLDASVTHQGIWASHPEAPGGVDFILFIKSGIPQLLEIGFFGFPVPKTILAKDSSDLAFQV